MSEFPDFTIPIEDENAATFWLEEWWHRFRQTGDDAFIEAAIAMTHYMDRYMEEEA